MEKTCKNCGQPVLGKRSDAAYCSVLCGNRYRNRKHYRQHPEEFREKREKYNHHFERKILSTIKHKCKKLGIPFDLSVEDILVPKFCPVLGMELKRSKGMWSDNSPSVDRIYPSKGYVKGNVRVISCRANLLKSNATIEELTLVLEDLKRVREEEN